MDATMGELLAMSETKLKGELELALCAVQDAVTRKQALIAALSVLLGEPRKPATEWLERIAAKARQDGN